MELAVLALFIVIYTEMREYRHREQMKRIDENSRKLRLGEHVMSRRLAAQCATLEKLDASIKALSERADVQAKFIDKAHTDLETLVKEYEINGVPLGYDRTGGKKPDFYEVG